MQVDEDGNYIASIRNFNQVIKIDGRSGEILWRFGGLSGQFDIQGDPLNGFWRQHFARILPNGDLLLYDSGNNHEPSETRIVEYALDLETNVATLVWESRHDPLIFTSFAAVQRLSNGNTFIGYAPAGQITEVDPSGTVVWEATMMVDGEAARFYRSLEVPSLYEYVRP